MNLRAQNFYEHKTQDTKIYESKGTRCFSAKRQKIVNKAPKILRTEGESRI